MINNLFDKHVKEQVGATRPDVPAHVWENIIAKKDRKKPVGFFTGYITKMIAAALLVLVTGIGIIYLSVNKHTSDTNDILDKTNSNKNNTVIIKNKHAEGETALNQSAPVSAKTDNTQSDINPNTNTSNNFYLGKSATKVFLKPGDFFSENDLRGIKNSDEQFLKSRYIFNDLKQRKYSFDPALQLHQLPVSLFIPCPEAEKNTAGNKKYFEVYGGPDYLFHSLSDTAHSVYLQQRKASVKYLFAYSVGIRYTKVFSSGMSFRTGVNYSQVNEQFKSEKGRITQNVYITNTNGDTTGSYVQTGTQYKTSTNKYRSIDIPVSIGYELGNGRLHTNVNAGIMINVKSSQKGFMLDNNGNAVDISSGKSSSVYQYKTKAGISFTAATSVYYKLTEKMHLMAEPYVKLSLSSMTKPEISLKEKFHTAGVRLGVRMDL